jgi:hypothetical protein
VSRYHPPIRQSANPPIRQSANPPIRQSANPPIRQSGGLTTAETPTDTRTERLPVFARAMTWFEDDAAEMETTPKIPLQRGN